MQKHHAFSPIYYSGFSEAAIRFKNTGSNVIPQHSRAAAV
jgi:hypothetical protein